MGELILCLLDGIFISFPSKRNRKINKKFKILRKEMWYKERHSTVIQLNHSVRNFVENKDIETLLKDPNGNLRLQIEFEKILMKENL